MSEEEASSQSHHIRLDKRGDNIMSQKKRHQYNHINTSPVRETITSIRLDERGDNMSEEEASR